MSDRTTLSYAAVAKALEAAGVTDPAKRAAANEAVYKFLHSDECDGTQLAFEVSDFVNHYDRDDFDRFVDTMSREHRTLQQSFTRLAWLWLKKLAALPEGWFDLRNEASVKFAKKVAKEEEYFPLV